MPEFWRRARTPLVFAALVVLATTTMMSDRSALREGGRELSWFEGAVLDVSTPVQGVLAAPEDALKGLWAGYVDLKRSSRPIASKVVWSKACQVRFQMGPAFSRVLTISQ